MACRFELDEDELRYGLRYQDDVEENEKGYGRGAGDSKSASKRGAPHTRGTAISFGFRKRGAAPSQQQTGIPVPVAQYPPDLHQRSKSVGPEHESSRRSRQQQHQQQLTSEADDYECYNLYQPTRYGQYSSSGRSTPRLAPPKKESSGLPMRTNRFGFRSQTRYTDKVTDLATFNSHLNVSQVNQYNNQDTRSSSASRTQSRSPAHHQSKPRPSPVNQPGGYHHGINNNNLNNNNNFSGGYNSNINNNNNNNNPQSQYDANRRLQHEVIASTQGKYTLHTSHLPQPQYAMRVTDATSKVAKTAANQSRKVGGVPGGGCSSKEGSGTEDSGLGSQHGGCYSDASSGGRSRYDYYGRQRMQMQQQQQQMQQQHQLGKPRKLNVVVSGKSFDVRDVDDEEHVVTEISVIQLPSDFNVQKHLQRANTTLGQQQHGLGTGLVRERTALYQRAILSKDNRYNDSTTSVCTSASASTTTTSSSEGYDEGLGEEKVYGDRLRTEKLATSATSICSSNAASTSSLMMMRGSTTTTGNSGLGDTELFGSETSDEQEFGHGGEAMADEYSVSSCDDLDKHQRQSQNHQRSQEPNLKLQLQQQPCNTVTQTASQHFKAIANAAKSGALPKSTLRSVMLTIEDPAFAAVAATTTTLIDDETSPVDSLFDSPTQSVSQADVAGGQQQTKQQKRGSIDGLLMERSGNTLDDDSPGTPTNASLSLSEGREYFDDEIADQPGLVFDETLKDMSGTHTHTEHSQTVLETLPKNNGVQGRSVENSPMHGRRIHRAGSVSTLSSCESLASDDLMMDYERSDASSFGDVNSRGNSTFVMQDLDDATSLLDLEIQGQETMKEWNSMLGQTQQVLSNSANNNSSSNNNISSSNNNNNNNNQNADSGKALVKRAQIAADEDEPGGDYYQLTFPN